MRAENKAAEAAVRKRALQEGVAMATGAESKAMGVAAMCHGVHGAAAVARKAESDESAVAAKLQAELENAAAGLVALEKVGRN